MNTGSLDLKSVGPRIRMMMPLLKRRDPFALALLAAVFVAIGLLRLPLVPVLLIAIPLSVVVAFILRRRGAS